MEFLKQFAMIILMINLLKWLVWKCSDYQILFNIVMDIDVIMTNFGLMMLFVMDLNK